MATENRTYPYKQQITLLCIPLLETAFTEEYIRNVFYAINITEIPKIIEIPNKTNPRYKRVILYVYLDDTIPIHKCIKTRFQEKKDIKLVYQEPWYWKITEAYRGK